jgi:hypothetical protein
MEKVEISNVQPEIARSIFEEEKLRYKIRAEIAATEGPSKNPALSLWTFLNSQFALFLLGAVFVSGLGGAFTYWHQWQHENEVRNETGRKLLAEFDFRLNDLDTIIAKLASISDPQSKGENSMYVWRAARGDTAYQPALPEYKNVHWAGIVIQIDTLGFGANTYNAIQATRELENGGSIPAPNGYSLYPPGFLEQRSQILHKFSESAWQKLDPRHTSSLTPDRKE